MIKTRQKKACLRKLKKLLKSSWNNWNRFILVIQTETIDSISYIMIIFSWKSDFTRNMFIR